MSHIPADLQYTEQHEWIQAKADSPLLTVGITHHAQEALGDIVFLELPTVGHKVLAGDAVCVIESVKAASDIYAPVSGEIIEINTALADAPEAVNQTPYASWLFKIKPDSDMSTSKLIDAVAYVQLIG